MTEIVKLPERVRVLGFDWTITSPDLELQQRGRYGETHYLGFEIHVDSSQPLQRQRETLLHELIHAGCEQFLIGDDDVSETQIRVVAHTLYQVFADNPAVREFIFGSMADGR